MSQNGRRPFRCRCGRDTNRPEVVRGLLLCGECAFDEQYGSYVPGKGRPDPKDYIQPRFRVRRIA